MYKGKKFAILHAFFKNRGGAEKLVFAMRNHYNADLYAGAVRSDIFLPTGVDSFSKDLYDPKYTFNYLHEDGKKPILYHLKRQFHFMFNPKINELLKYDVVLFSGNIFWVAGRLHKHKKRPLLVNYCNTPPRIFTDQEDDFVGSKAWIVRPFLRLVGRYIRFLYKKDLQRMDVVIANSRNIQSRIKTYLGIDSIPIFVPADTNRFKYISTQDYFLSHSRLEDAKRIRLIIEAFKQMPDKKLKICSSGPLAQWLQDQIKEHNLTNIEYLGLVTDQELDDLVGNCLAGIVIPVQEDAGIVQLELMAAGKPVIGVEEGGLLETVLDGQTGFMIKANPDVEDLKKALTALNPETALSMKQKCIEHAKGFDNEVFFSKLDSAIFNAMK